MIGSTREEGIRKEKDRQTVGGRGNEQKGRRKKEEMET